MIRRLRRSSALSPLAAATAALFLGGCPGYQPRAYQPPQLRFGRVPSGLVATPGVRIAAEDGSFTLGDGAPFTPPFDLAGECPAKPEAEFPEDGLAAGARRVDVTVPEAMAQAAGVPTVVHGLLALCGVPPGATGAATRQYAIQVPTNRLRDTSGGRVSVVYEPFLFGSGDAGGAAWILWLSQAPFPDVPSPRAYTSTARAYLALDRQRFDSEEAARQRAAEAEASDASDTIWLLLLAAGAAVGLAYAASDL